MRKQVQFKVSLIAAAISMMAGSATAIPPSNPNADGNELVGPDVNTTGTAIVKIDQSGTGNITSKTGLAAGGAFIVDQSAGATTVLTIQQVGGGNTLGLSAFTNAATSVRVFQGADAADGNTGNLGAAATSQVYGNQAVIGIGLADASRAEASDVFLTQQGNGIIVGLYLGQVAGVFTGIVNLLQVGAGNRASVTIDGQTTTGQSFNIGQRGFYSNSLSLVANGDQTTGMTLDFGGGLTWDRATSVPDALATGGNANAAYYDYNVNGTNAGLKTSFTGALTGIHVLGTDVFKISTSGAHNSLQVDLSAAAATGNKIDVNLDGGGNHFAVYGQGSATVNLGGSGTLSVYGGKELVVYANGGTVSVNDVDLYGNSYLSTADGGSITMSGGSVSGLSVVQSGAAHTFSSTNQTFDASTWNVAQAGPVGNSMTANNAGSYAGGTFTLTQTSEAGGGAHSMTLNNAAEATLWTVTQTGAGAKTLGFTNSTYGATINATQSGANTQSATGIDFAAASGSFTLVQR